MRTDRWTMFKSRNVALYLGAAAIVVASSLVASAASDPKFGFGQHASPAQVSAWEDDVNGLTGAGLPPGHGTVAQGQKVFAAQCASCHGDFGEGAGRYPVLAGGQGTLTAERPVPTVGSYWPYAPTLFDYIRRAMPFGAPGSLSNDDVYAVTAYVLNLNSIVPNGATLDAVSLAAIKMPNREGFINEHLKPDVHNVACMKHCRKGPVVVTGDLAKSLGVTPEEKGDSLKDIAALVAASHQADDVMNSAAAAQSGSPATPHTGANAASRSSHIASPAASVSFAMIQPIVAQRCTVCHADHPTQAGFTSAPMGVKLDTPEHIKAQAAKIVQQAVASQQMPIGNVTHMTAQERILLGKWVAAGADIH